MFKNRVPTRILGLGEEVRGGGNKTTIRRFVIFTLHQTLSNKIKENEVGRICSTHGGHEIVHKMFVGKSQEKRWPGIL
jgi:hypothetical protein